MKSLKEMGRYLDGRRLRCMVGKLLQTCLFAVYRLIWFSGRDLVAFHIGVILEHVQKILCLTLSEFQV
jgi:hypothetical protein